jgi:signal transduction histidine kinase
MAHDFNNLMTAILGYASLARARALEPEVRDALNQILRAGDRAKNIAQQILDFSGQQRNARTHVDVTAVAQEVLQLMRHIIPAKVEVVADLSHDCGMVFANATQLHQVVVNLCHNAVHAMRDIRGRLVVRVAPVEVDQAFAKMHPGARVGSYVGLSVIDNGHGMDPATQRRIFEPFFTTKAAGVGTGLGLAVVQRIVRDHDGVIHVTSLPGEGTVFQVLFPAARDRTSGQPSRHL